MKPKTLVTTCLVSIALSATAAHAAEIRTVALTGQQAPGMPEGVNFTFSQFTVFFLAPQALINDAGQTAFNASVTGGNGIWSEGSGNLALVARSGSPAPGTPSGLNYNSFIRLQLNNAGQTAFTALLTGSGVDITNREGIWSEGSGSLALVARSGDHAPGAPDAVKFSFNGNSPSLNDAGQIAFGASLTSSGVDVTRSIWSNRSSSLELVTSAGDHASGMPDGVNFGFVDAPVFNNAGQTAFRAFLTGNGVDSNNSIGIWSEGSGSLTLVARAGDHAPGMPDGVNFYQFDQSNPPALNNVGQTAFKAELIGSGINSTDSSSIWSEGSGSLAVVAREGDHAPGAPDGVNFTGFNRPSVLNDAGQTLFIAGFTGGFGIFSGEAGSLSMVARAADHAPGTPDGVTFDTFFSYQLNNSGQTAFIGFLGGAGVDATNNRGIFATDRSGDLQLIARMGDLLEVAPGDLRTISFLTFTGERGIASNGFNKLGQLVFAAAFTDGTAGIFVSNRVAVPEPASFSAILICTVCLTFHRRRNTP